VWGFEFRGGGMDRIDKILDITDEKKNPELYWKDSVMNGSI
jgi:hypothetical protein